MKLDITINLVKSQAKVLKDYIDTVGEISHSSALIAIAKIYGYKEWNTFNAYLKSKE
jgi:hypothetical protein